MNKLQTGLLCVSMIAAGGILGGMGVHEIDTKSLEKPHACPTTEYGEGFVFFRCAGSKYNATKTAYVSAHPMFKEESAQAIIQTNQTPFGSDVSQEVYGCQVHFRTSSLE